MNRTNKLAISALISLLTTSAIASGQRTESITPTRVANYPVIDMQNPAASEQVLHYVGSTAQWHLLMITRTAVSRSASGQLGMPWDKVFAYKVPVTDLDIDNGWLLDDHQLADGITARPDNCPRVTLEAGRKHIALPDSPQARQSCLKENKGS